MCGLQEDHLSASDDDEANHNIWNAFLDLMSNFDVGRRMRLSLAELDEAAVMRWTGSVQNCTRSEGLMLDHD